MIVDIRCRPPTEHYATYFDPERVTWHAQRYGATQMPPAYLERSMDLFWQEMDDAKIDVGVVLGRNSPAVFMGKQFNEAFIPNEHVAELQDGSGGRLIGFAGIDVSNQAHDAVAETHRSITELRLRGVFIEPGRVFGTDASDERIWPTCEACLELDVPVNVMTGPYAGADIGNTHPIGIDRLATRFPDLKIIAGHGAWPWIDEMLGVAYKHPNVFVSPDMYLFTLGTARYVEAINGALREQMLFASAYPLRPLREAVDACTELPLEANSRDSFMGENAARLLGLES